MKRKTWHIFLMSAMISSIIVPLNSTAVQAETIGYAAICSGEADDCFAEKHIPAYADVYEGILSNGCFPAFFTGAGSSSGYNLYTNARFGYSMSYPAWFVQVGDLPTNGDGIWMAGNGARLTMSGEYNVLGHTPKSYFEMAARGKSITKKEIDSHSVGYYTSEYPYEKYYYTEISDALCISFYLEYPIAEHDKYQQIIKTMKNSIRW